MPCSQRKNALKVVKWLSENLCLFGVQMISVEVQCGHGHTLKGHSSFRVNDVYPQFISWALRRTETETVLIHIWDWRTAQTKGSQSPCLFPCYSLPKREERDGRNNWKNIFQLLITSRQYEHTDKGVPLCGRNLILQVTQFFEKEI